MIRALYLLALTALVIVGAMRLGNAQSLSPLRAPPSTSLPTTDAIESTDAVPVSMVIRNAGDDDDRLLGGSTPVARRIDVHRTHLVDGRREMQPVPGGLSIPADGSLILEPAASHLMLIGLQTDLVQGETFPITLRFAHAGEVTVTARVRRRVDAAGLTPIPTVVMGDLSLALASAPPAPAGTPTPEHDRSLH